MNMAITLRGPVGDLSGTKTQGNFPEDVKQVKQVISRLGIDSSLSIDGHFDLTLTAAIIKFQNLFLKRPDGRIDPKGGSHNRLNELASGKAVVVNLKRQVLDAYFKLDRMYHFNCAAGDASNPTPPGYYKIQQGRKHEKYRSKKYDAQMDYAMFFHEGYAIHMAYGVAATSFLKWAGVDSLGSHGCVRLSESDAKTLFQWTPEATPVVILPT